MRSALIALLVVAACGPLAAADPPPVRAELLADVAQVQAGRPFDVGVRLTVPAGWHIYWRYPGDSGLPTVVRFTLPDGFIVGPLRWPVPTRFEQPGGIVGYGYAGEVLLAATVTPPPAPTDATAVRAEARWLACEQQCIPGRAALDLALPGATPAPESFARATASVPLDAAASPAAVATSGRVPAGGGWGTLTVTLDWHATPPATLDWFPAPPAGLAVEDATVRTDGTRTTVTFRARTLAGTAAAPPTLDAVVGWGAGGDRRGLALAVPL